MKTGIYIFPTFFTMLNLGLGFYAILSVIDQRFSHAAWAIVASHFCDILDGRIARMTNTTSTFGLEFDSFADWISFGIAPALMMYQLILHAHGKFGFAVALFFVLAGSLRLARFNVRAHALANQSQSHFIGLPIPAAGGLLAAFVLVYELFYNEITVKTIPLVMQNVPMFYKSMPIIMFFLGVAMLSRVRWNSFKAIKFSRPKPLRTIMIALAFGLLIYAYPENFIFLLYLAYVLWGVFGFFARVQTTGDLKRGEADAKEQGSYI